MRKSTCLLVCLLSALTFLPTVIQAATKMLMLNPVRVLFVDRYRSVKLSVGNPNDQVIPYKVSLVTMRRGADGQLYKPDVETEEELFVKSLIRFSPRRAFIDPKTHQIVKLMVRKPQDLPAGEYQTRLQIMPLEETKTKEQDAEQQAGKSFEIDMIVGVTIPIIIQHGDLHAEVTPLSLAIENLSAVPSGLAAKVSLERSGDCSAFGDVVVYSSPGSNNSKGKEIGRGRQVAIYLQDDNKDVTIPLHDFTRKDLTSGSLRVEFHPVIPGQDKVPSRSKDSVSSKIFRLGQSG